MSEAPRRRVLLLAREQVLHWVPLYIEAFRECCDVITVGPALRVNVLATHDWQHAQRWLEPNNIESEADSLAEILTLLPGGWLPELIVTVQSAGPPIRDLARAACPTVYISVDTWHDHEEFRYARPYDFVFAAQESMVAYFRDAGLPRVEWLPLACSPRRHHPVDTLPTHDFAFAGMTVYVVNRQRMARLLRLEKEFTVRIEGALGGDDYCRALAAGRAVFNSSVAQDVNMRVFEAMAVGRPLLTNRDAAANGLYRLFTEGEHFLGYDDEDLMTQARCLMEDGGLRDCLAEAAKREVLERHTYRHRVGRVLEVVGPHAYPTPTLRGSLRLSAWIPHGSRRVLDIGLKLDRSRVGLRRMGVEFLAGTAPRGEAGRPGSYDAIVPWPPHGEKFDAILCAHPLDATLPLPELFGAARDCLGAGGELVLLMNGGEATLSGLNMDPALWEAWSYAEGFHLILCQPIPECNGLALRFRRYLRSLEDISRDIFARFPGGGNHPEVRA
ncbi:MAG: hypothetical protein RLZZ303_2376 [Candidatus Hydrogenedentota bacterium]|jgi:glycosyltransferase involved in cell wall biosynthesis